jgi:YD repeat-containing protein
VDRRLRRRLRSGRAARPDLRRRLRASHRADRPGRAARRRRGPVDQGGPRTPAANGAVNDTAEAADKADPVNPANGELYLSRVDLALPGFGVAFAHTRTYRSRIDYAGVLGHGWDFSYNRRLLTLPDRERVRRHDGEEAAYPTIGDLPLATRGRPSAPLPVAPSPSCGPEILYLTGAGSTLRFRQVGETSTDIFYVSADGVHRTLRGRRVDDEVSWTLTEPGGISETFDALGLLTAIHDANGVGLAIDWEAAAGDWRVASVTDSVGRIVDYGYDAAGKLATVRERRSGLVARYSYQGGDLASATDATGRAESYEYDVDVTRGGGDWVPEGYLLEACQDTCAPASSSCDAGGACDVPVAVATRACMASCQKCGRDCAAEVCDGGCIAACDAGTAATPGCTTQCLDHCADPATGVEIAVRCNQLYAEEAQAACESCEDTCEALDSGCDVASLCVQAAGGFDGGGADPVVVGDCLGTFGKAWALGEDALHFVLGVLGGAVDVLSCGADLVCGLFGGSCGDCDFDTARDQFEKMCNQDFRRCCRDGRDCAAGSCNAGHGCVADCRAAFLGEANGNTCAAVAGAYDGAPITVDEWAASNGCKPLLDAACGPRCKAECRGLCVPDCRGVCQADCAEACHSNDCPGYCDSLDLMGSCQEGCVDGCVAAAHEVGPFVGAKYGYPRDLDHNLVRIRDGNGQIYLEVTYGTDLASPDFDSVVAQTYGDFEGEIAYRDLEGEERGSVAPPTSGLAAAIVSREAFGPVEICPSSCAPPARDHGPGELVPWRDLLLELAPGKALGGLPVDSPRGQLRPVAPDVLALRRVVGGVLATSQAGGRPLGAEEARASRFDVLLDAGRVTFLPAADRGYLLSGPAEALDALVALRSVTLLSNGAGRLRVYPGAPRSLIRVAVGSCSEPFLAELDGGGLSMAPATACSDDLVLAPLASVLPGDSAAAANVRRDRRAVAEPAPRDGFGRALVAVVRDRRAALAFGHA